MRGRVAVPFLLVLCFSLPALADCNWTPRYSAQFRTTALDVSTAGGLVWLATGYGVQLLDANGEILDSLALPGITRTVEVAENGLAYAGSGSRIYILQRSGTSISVAGEVAAGGAINEILASGSYLFVATSNGIEHYELFTPIAPRKTNAVLVTSSPNVTSLAIARNVLYAADGDGTVETYSISIPSIPQGTGALETVQLATAVHATSDGYVFVSDRFGQNTDMFSGTIRVARVPYGATSFAPTSTSFVHFLAGPDRTLRAVDFSTVSKVAEIFESQLAPTDGTDNVIHAIERAGDLLYVAAGDIGLVTYDVGDIARPYPLVSYATGATTSVVVDGNKAWFADATGKVSEQTVNPAGVSLGEVRNWQTIAGAVVRDQRRDLLLVTSGSVAQTWSIAGGTPTLALQVNFPDVISDAIIGDLSIVARLVNGGIWAVPVASPVKVAIPNMTLVARSNASIVFAQILEEEGKTVLHHYAGDNFTAAPRTFTVDGVATSLALDATRAAIFTFRGINVIDLASGAVRVIPGSDQAIARELVFSGSDLLAIDVRHLYVYDDAQVLVREHYLPADAIAAGANGSVAVLATNEGVAASLTAATLPVPDAPFTNSYYTKAVSGGDRVYLLDDEGVDVFATGISDAPHKVIGIRAGGIVDIAASVRGVYTLAGNGTVSAWSPAGALLAQRTIDEGPDTQPLAIFTAGDAIWVALSRSCSSGNCEKKTLLLDPATLATTASMPGAAEDVFVSGTRAYALFDLDYTIRTLDIANALQPVQIASVTRPNASRSIAFDGTHVQVLGNKLYAHDPVTLAAAGERFESRSSSLSQRIRIAGGCAIITGRSEAPELYSVPSWTAATSHGVPSPVTSIALEGGKVFLLTGHSLEIWATGPAVEPGRRRAVR